jgi:hypothetical protein
MLNNMVKTTNEGFSVFFFEGSDQKIADFIETIENITKFGEH